MNDKYVYLIVGVILGWVIKIPFLIKWYKELKRTKVYKKAMDGVEYKEMVDRYNLMYPLHKIKI